MTVITCTDKRMGISNNGKRLASDDAIIEKIRRIAGGATVYMTEYSATLFAGVDGISYECARDPVAAARNRESKTGQKTYCFLEGGDISQPVSEIILFGFGKEYPHDKKLVLNWTDYMVTGMEELTGKSLAERIAVTTLRYGPAKHKGKKKKG